ncbi:thioesterase family protein [Alteribacillus bidgolensis]|uniref:Acyl-CoA thioester hydrolase n=1 Tax=Alteribacillus bidgolensis TaxID=930129 RepID=A0A1G8I811_9BACI|nr:thioesterase family protein [Alteribacillus bidgolensis]SDI14977.1 acyl-CoA thioester hydrolase [Alteribacillus bidgolensis]
MVDFTKPITSETIQREWVDYNGHMNDAAYASVFSLAVDKLMELIGLDEAGREHFQYTVYTLETHLCYLKEAYEGEELDITFQLLDYDAKRMHVFFFMTNTNGEELAVSEQMLMGIDIKEERPAPFPEEVYDVIKAASKQQENWSVPDRAGRKIGIRKK